MRRRVVFLIPLLLGAACGGGSGGSGGGGNPPPNEVSFALDVLPLLQSECTICHGGAGGLTLDTWADLMAGGTSGAVVVPGDSEASLIRKRLDNTIAPQMPLDAPPLTGPEIDRIRLWIDQGAKDN